jgi:PAS domain S-box-containing protein
MTLPDAVSPPPARSSWLASLRRGPGALWAGRSAARWLVLVASYAALVLFLGVVASATRSALPVQWCAVSGPGLAFLVLVGPRILPALLFGRFVDAVRDSGTFAQSPDVVAVAILQVVALGLVVETAMRWGRLDYRIGRTRDAWVLTAAVAVVAALWSALDTGAALLAGRLAPESAFAFAQTAWLSEAVGMVAIAPLVLTVGAPAWERRFASAERAERRETPDLPLGPQRGLETLAWLVALAGVVALALGSREFEREYLCLLPMIALALRGGVPGAAAGAFVAAFVAFAVLPADGVTQPPDLGFFLLVLSLTGLSLGALVQERASGIAALRRSQARLEQAQSLARLGHWELDRRSLRLRVYAAARDLLGRGEADATPIADILRAVHPEDRERVLRAHARVVAEGGPLSLEYRALAPDGGVRHLASTVDWSKPLPGREPHVTGSVLDITERVRAEETLRASEQRFRQLVENLEPGFWLVGADGWRLRYVSPSLLRLWNVGADEIYGRSVLDAFETVHADDRERMLREFAGLLSGVVQRGYGTEFRQMLPGGELRRVRTQVSAIRDENGALTGVSGVVTDVTEQRRLEERLAQAEKLESIGRLAGGVAHDFNNLLTVILGHLDLLGLTPGLEAAALEDVRQARTAAERATMLTRQLLAFARRQVVSPSVVDLAHLAREANELLRSLAGEAVQLWLHAAPYPLPARIDRGSFEQILVNLVTNARDAMPEGGRISIEVRGATPHERQHAGDGATIERDERATSAGLWLAVVVRDTGHGMSEHVLEHAFEPFFTTKEPGKGTGLGLASCYGIVQQANGRIRVESAPGKGATFTVLLPCAPLAALDGEAAATRAPAVAGGSETVLLVEDEPLVRALGVRALSAMGYRVLDAAHGLEALAIVRAHEGPLDLVVTDVVMPELGGVALVEALQAERPGLPVLLVSGYREASEGHERLPARTAFLEKPYVAATLQARVRAILDATPSGDAS